LSGPADFTSSAANDATQRLAHAKLAYDVARVGTVIERLAALDRNDPTGRFTGRLDLTRIGALGYSFGGAVAFAAARHDPRVRAVLNMDGWLFDAASGYRGGFPYFVMSDRGALPGADELASANPVVRYTARLTLSDERIQAAALAHGGYELRIAGAQHLNFSDVPLYTLRHRGGVDPHAVSRTVRAYAVAFFDHTLRGARPALLADPRSTGELTFNRWPFERRGNH
jgi:dienelactone hydrolase